MRPRHPLNGFAYVYATDAVEVQADVEFGVSGIGRGHGFSSLCD
jgi:hypothetical protein